MSREFRPATGTPASPDFGERSGEKVDLHIGQWKDGRWSYIFGEGTDYASVKPDLEAIERAHEVYRKLPAGGRDDAVAMQYLVPGWRFDPKRPCLVR